MAPSVTAAPVPAGSDVTAYDAAVQHAFAQVQAAVAASHELKAVPSNLEPSVADASGEQKTFLFHGCVRDFFEGGQPECATGDTASPTTVALVGDSHAAMLNPAFQHFAAQRPWRLELMAKAGCPLLDVPIDNPFSRLIERFRHCEQWRAQIIARLRAEHPRLVMVSLWRRYGAGSWEPGFTPYDPAWIDSLTRLVLQLRATGAKVLVLGPVPDPQSVVPICLSGHLDDVTACAPLRLDALDERGIAAESAATLAAGGQYADLTDLFCTADRCPVIVGNTLVYQDWSHLTREYSLLLAPVMEALADRAIVKG